MAPRFLTILNLPKIRQSGAPEPPTINEKTGILERKPSADEVAKD
jgi:hypothetical protein